MSLRDVTGAPVAVSAEERKYVPTGIETVTSTDKEKRKRQNRSGTH